MEGGVCGSFEGDSIAAFGKEASMFAISNPLGKGNGGWSENSKTLKIYTGIATGVVSEVSKGMASVAEVPTSQAFLEKYSVQARLGR